MACLRPTVLLDLAWKVDVAVLVRDEVDRTTSLAENEAVAVVTEARSVGVFWLLTDRELEKQTAHLRLSGALVSFLEGGLGDILLIFNLRVGIVGAEDEIIKPLFH